MVHGNKIIYTAKKKNKIFIFEQIRSRYKKQIQHFFNNLYYRRTILQK